MVRLTPRAALTTALILGSLEFNLGLTFQTTFDILEPVVSYRQPSPR